MRTKKPLVIVRPVHLIAVAVILAACAASSPPSDRSAATSTTRVPVPSVSIAPPASVSPSSVVAPTSPADGFVNLPASEGVLNALWKTDRMAVAGGFAGPVFTATILAFDGTSWSIAEVPDAPGQVTGIAKLGDRWIAVGNGLPDVRNAFIWDSTDGRVWRTVQAIENAAIYDVIAADRVVVAVGARLDAEMNATATAWSSTDGTSWGRAAVGGSGEASMGSVTTTPVGFVATGDRRLGNARPIWTATTATSWKALHNDLSDQLLPSDIVAWEQQYALVGASGKSGDQHPFVALSSDGRAWKRSNLSADEGYASAVTVANDRLVVAGVDADRLTLWSPRESAWEADRYEPTGASISALTWDSDFGLVAVGARDGRQAVWVFEGY